MTATTEAFLLHLIGVNQFTDDASNVQTYFVAINPAPELLELRRSLVGLCESVDPVRMAMPYVPHITLANKPPEDMQQRLWRQANELPVHEAFTATAIQVYTKPAGTDVWTPAQMFEFNS